MLLGLGVLTMLPFGLNARVRADEQADIEAKLRAVVSKQQELEQEAQALRKQLDEVKAEASDYVKITVKGKLIALGAAPWYGVRANKGAVLVRFVRSEDKNRQLDEHLKSLEGKEVVVEGYFFRVAKDETAGGAQTVLDIDLHDEAQVKAVGEK